MIRRLISIYAAAPIALAGLIASAIQMIDVIDQGKVSMIGLGACASAVLLLTVLAARMWRRSIAGGAPPTPRERVIVLSSVSVVAISLAVFAAACTVVSIRGPLPRPPQPRTQIYDLAAGTYPAGIAAGPAGDMWFTEQDADKVASVSPNGSITEYAIPTRGGRPFAITLGPDGNMWFTEGRPDAASGDRIGRITSSGDMQEYPLPTRGANPVGIASGSDGNLWFTEYNGEKIGRITANEGHIDEFALPGMGAGDPGERDKRPDQIVAGPDGALWFTEFTGNRIGRITVDGLITEYDIPTPNSHPVDIVTGADGDLWFTEFDGNRIGRITARGEIVAEIDLRTAAAGPAEIAVGADHQLWFAELKGNKIGSVATDGQIAEYSVASGNDQPEGVALAPDGVLWFTMPAGDRIGNLRLNNGGGVSISG